ncbi:MAG: signal peptidase I [Rikenellaceae bacterium]
MFSKIKKIWSNPYVKFGVVGLIYLLWFVLWAENLWWIFGLIVIYDVYVSKFMYRLFWGKHLERKKSNKLYKKSSEWVEAIVFATVVASVIRIFFFEMYVIPSSSMEKTLLIGDYLCVSKVSYGPKMPNTPVAFPFVHHTMPFSATKKSFSEIITRPYKRLSGFRDLERNDIVVFNFPAGDTVIVEEQSASYYDVLEMYEKQFGAKGRANLHRDYTIISRPVDKRENYIKRAVGMPGDTISIVNAQVYIDSKPATNVENLQINYLVYFTSPISKDMFDELGISLDEVTVYSHSSAYVMPLTKSSKEKVEQLKNVAKVTPYLSNKSMIDVFPKTNNGWSEDNFGPLWIPYKGASVELTLENLPLYERIIKVYEGHELKVVGEDIFIDNVKADSYTFAMNYYFMMGDNRHNSADSRYWGFVPEDHIVGAPSFVWLSLDKDKSFPANIRWSKMFRNITK